MAGLDCFADGDVGSKKRSPRRLIYLQGKIEHGDDTVYMAAETNGDGACGLHATWGDVVGDRYECLNARAKLYEDLSAVDGKDLDSSSSEFHEAFHSLLESVRTDLNTYAKNHFCGAVDREVKLIYHNLPRHCKDSLESFAKGREHEEAHKPVLEETLLECADTFFTLDREPLIRQLCVDLGYVRVEDVGDLTGEPRDAMHDPAELRFFEPSEDAKDQQQYMELFMLRPEADKMRKKFFANIKHNANPVARGKILGALSDLKANADSRLQKVLSKLHEALHNWYDISTMTSGSLEASNLWTGLRSAWMHPRYWFNIPELHFIMALTATNMECYLYSDEQQGFQRVARLPALASFDAPHGVSITRVVYTESRRTPGRGHFSRLLSLAEWNDLSSGLDDNDDVISIASKDLSAESEEEVSSDDASSSSSSDSTAEEPAEELICQPCYGSDGTAPDASEELSCKLCLGDDNEDNKKDHKDAGAKRDDSDLEWEDADDVSENSDLFHVEVDPDKDFITFEDEILERVDRLVEQLRDKPLLPLDPQNPKEVHQ